ncbi:unnamed protein product [Caenorhabditis sp. 36 PRJEB53466]|nr:unnamed protein product [Caenorhabditis sp. 36 PRJEB53466]
MDFFRRKFAQRQKCAIFFQLPPQYDYRQWFPMHISVQLKRMEGKLRSVDLVIEFDDSLTATVLRIVQSMSSTKKKIKKGDSKEDVKESHKITLISTI